jgi:hypothetical protein
MKPEIQNKLELFAENIQIVKKDFTWQNMLVKRLAALLYAQANRQADTAMIRSCYDLIKNETGVFSAFRGNMSLCLAALMSLAKNQNELFGKTREVYTLLKGEKLHRSDFLVVAAYQIASQTEVTNYASVVARTREFYDGMKANHFFMTGQDDYIFAAMLGLSNLEVNCGVERIEQIIQQLKGEFWDRNSVQSLAQVLVLGGKSEDVIDRVLALRDALRAQKIKLDKTYTLPTLGVLALLPVDIETIAGDIAEAQTFLRSQKGIGSFRVPTQELLLYAAAIVAGEYAADVKNGILTAALSTSITNIIIAQEAAIIAAVSASSAAAAASSGN